MGPALQAWSVCFLVQKEFLHAKGVILAALLFWICSTTGNLSVCSNQICVAASQPNVQPQVCATPSYHSNKTTQKERKGEEKWKQAQNINLIISKQCKSHFDHIYHMPGLRMDSYTMFHLKENKEVQSWGAMRICYVTWKINFYLSLVVLTTNNINQCDIWPNGSPVLLSHWALYFDYFRESQIWLQKTPHNFGKPSHSWNSTK